jgi:hypothetical protein
MLYINNNNGTYHRLWNLVNNSVSLAVGYKPGTWCSLKWYASTGTCRSFISYMCN